MADRLLHHLAGGGAGKVVLADPAGIVELAGEVGFAGLERFEGGRLVAEEVHPHGLNVHRAAAERNVPAPVVGIARQLDEAAVFVVGHDVGSRCDRDLLAVQFGKIDPLPLRLLQDRADAGDQRQLAVRGVEGDPDRSVAGLLDLLDLGPEAGIAGMALRPQRLERPDHILDGDRRAVRKRRFGTQRELDPTAILRRLDRFGEQPVERERLVEAAAHQRLGDQERQLPGHRPLADIRVETVEAADLCGGNAPAHGRLRVGVGQRHKTRWQSRLAIHSDAMAVGPCRGGREHEAEGDKHAASGGEEV